MKVIHLIDSGGLYGAENVILHLVTEQRRSGIAASIGSLAAGQDPEKAIEVEAKKRGIPCERIRVPIGGVIAGGAVARCINAASADIVHTHGYKPTILLGLLCPWSVRAVLIATLHGWTGCASWFDRMRLYRALNTLALKRFDRAVHVSYASRANSGGRGEVIWNGIPPRGTTGGQESKAGLAEESHADPLVVYAGRLSPEKGVDVLLEALAALRRRGETFRAIIAGEGPCRADLERRAERSGLAEQVAFVGYCADIVADAPKHAVVVIPSLSEGLPLVLLEAMRAGLAVVASSVGGIPEIIAPKRLARLFPSGDSEGLARALLRCWEDREETEEMIGRAHEFFSNRLTSFAMSSAYEALYRTALQRRNVA